jgi:hypothetical protein
MTCSAGLLAGGEAIMRKNSEIKAIPTISADSALKNPQNMTGASRSGRLHHSSIIFLKG